MADCVVQGLEKAKEIRIEQTKTGARIFNTRRIRSRMRHVCPGGMARAAARLFSATQTSDGPAADICAALGLDVADGNHRVGTVLSKPRNQLGEPFALNGGD